MGSNASRLAAACSAAALLAACSYDYRNPAETLRAGEVRGRVLADAGAGVSPNAGVSVTLKNSDLTQVSRDTGLFVVVPLPAGRHTLLFRKGTTWAIEREVEVPVGRDGQPEGVSLGDVTLRYSAEVGGTMALPASFPPGAFGGIVVDLTTGMTAVPSGTTWGFPVLSTGKHRLTVAAEDSLGGQWVGGPIELEITEDAQQQSVQVQPVVMRPASGQGQLRFQVQAVGGSVDPTTVSVVGLPGVVTPDADGFVEVTVPEGRYAIGLGAPTGGFAAPGGPAGALALPALEPPKGTVEVVVLKDEVAELGSIYLVAPEAVSQTLLGCVSNADCACLGAGCEVDGTCDAGGMCQDWTPPPAAPATTPFCAQGGQRAGCFPGDGCQKGEYCVAFPTSGGFCLPCGTACTWDGLTSTQPSAGECPVTVGVFDVTGTYLVRSWDETGGATFGPPRGAGALAVSVLPVGGSTLLSGTYDPVTGAFRIPNVPTGPGYTLVLDERASGGLLSGVQTAGTGLSILAEVSGRASAVVPTAATPITFDLQNLTAWKATDRLSVFSAGGGTRGDLLAAPISLNAVSGTVTYDWSLDLAGSGLADGNLGDVLWVTQLATTTVGNIPAGATVRNTTTFSRQTPATMQSGSILPGVLAAAPQTGTLSLTMQESPWAGMGADLPSFVTPLRTVLRVHALPHGTTFPAPQGVDPTLWQALVPNPSSDFSFTTSYGQFLDANWQELVWVRRVWQASYTAAGASVPDTVLLSVYSEWPVGQLPATPSPVVSPPRFLTVNGLDAFQPRSGVGLAPTISWTAPVLGAPTRYQVSIQRVENVNASTAVTNLAVFQVYAPSFTLPAGLLVAGGEYIAVVSAIQTPNDGLGSAAAWAGDYPLHLATNVTAIFTP